MLFLDAGSERIGFPRELQLRHPLFATDCWRWRLPGPEGGIGRDGSPEVALSAAEDIFVSHQAYAAHMAASSQFVTFKRDAGHRKPISPTSELSIALTLPLGSAGTALLWTAKQAERAQIECATE